MRNNKMITRGKLICFDLLTSSLNHFFEKCMEASLEKLYFELSA